MSAPAAQVSGKKRTVRRSVLDAVFFSLVTPGVGHLYNGIPHRALTAVVLVLGMQALILGASLAPPVSPSIGYLSLGLRGFGLFLMLAITVDAGIGARRAGEIELRPYNRAPVYLLFMALWFGEYFVFNEVHDSVSRSGLYVAESGTMEPTLLRDEQVLGHKHYYDSSEPVRGEVVAVRDPAGRDEVYLLRIVGLPGDRIAIDGGALMLNGQTVRRESADVADEAAGRRKAYTIHTETLPDGPAYRITEQASSGGFADNVPEKTVPQGSVYLLGDNRDKATDSRIFGPVPIEELESRLTYIIRSPEESRAGMEVQPARP